MGESVLNLECVDVVFRITAEQPLPAAHSYPLYSALSRRWPWLHEADDIGVFTIRGQYVNGRVHIDSRSELRLRTSAVRLPQVISLTGTRIQLGDADIQVGVPRVLPLRPAATVYARLVQIKLAEIGDGVTPEAFLASVNKQLDALHIQASASIPLRRSGPHAGQPQRRVLEIKGERHVGFALLVEGLTADESLRLQSQGLGGRRKMGCGLFLPTRGAR